MNYEQKLRAVGRLIDAASLHAVCVMERERGVLVVGLAPVTIADEHVLQPTSLELGPDLIEHTLRQLAADAEGRERGGPTVAGEPR